MRRRTTTVLACLLALAAALPGKAHVGRAAPLVLPAPPARDVQPWNGDWVISRTRNPRPIIDQAAEGYRFHIDAANSIVWEIPTLHEIVRGRLDGSRMPIRRPGAKGMALAVTAAGPQTLLYTVFRNGAAVGEGRMILAEQDRSWVDVSGPVGRPDLAGIVIYVRPGAEDR